MRTDPSPEMVDAASLPALLRGKAISVERDRTQSSVLVAVVSTLLVLAVLRLEITAIRQHHLSPWALGISAGFAFTVWRLRSATAPASAFGALLCLLLATPAAQSGRVLSPSLLPLIVLFLLTFAATRFRRHTKEAIGLAEPRSGRRTSQIIANLGTAGLCAAAGFYPGALASLAEATADTLSSEVGQALGGPTWLLTSLRRVPPGTDGGISLAGTAVGLLGAALVVFSGAADLASVQSVGIVYLAGVSGLVFDSLLGATVERYGWVGNDLVNFSSTVFAALLSWAILQLQSLSPR